MRAVNFANSLFHSSASRTTTINWNSSIWTSKASLNSFIKPTITPISFRNYTDVKEKKVNESGKTANTQPTYEFTPSTLVAPRLPRATQPFFPNERIAVMDHGITRSRKGPDYKVVLLKVRPHVGKKDIMAYLTQMYGMQNIVKVNTANYQGKKKRTRFRGLSWKLPDWKKVFVTVYSGGEAGEQFNVKFNQLVLSEAERKELQQKEREAAEQAKSQEKPK